MISNFRKKFPVILVLVLSAFVNIWNLWEVGLGNLYYSAGVYSMGQNFHAFFFNSLDSAGFISIDKPPLGLWIQVLFTKVFGFGGMVLLLPQAIAGILSVYLLYRIMDRRFGQATGIVSALVLALTPIFVAVNRNNTMDSILILMLLFAAEQVLKSAEKSSPKHLIFACVFIGLGFNIKMLQSYMIVPAVFMTYWIFSYKNSWKRPFLVKSLACLSALAILFAISFSWIAAVDLTPAQNRPYVGSSGTNSAMSLALGYNGINRIFGNGNKAPDSGMPGYQTQDRGLPGYQAPGGGMPGYQAPGGGMPGYQNPGGGGNASPNNAGGPKSESGSPSVFRLFNSQMAGQISWLLVPALLVSLFCLFRLGRAVIRKNLHESFRGNPQNILLTFFTMCFIPMLLYFSFSGGLAHRYYLAMFAFPVAALTGIGFSILQEKSKADKRILAWLTPAVFAVTAVVQLYIQSLYSAWLPMLLPVCAVLFTLALAGMIALILLKKPGRVLPFLAVLLILPGIWTITPMVYGDNAQLPITGPELVQQRNSFSNQRDLAKLVDYLKENKGNADYIASVPSAMQLGAELILQSGGEPVMVLGGFNGGDKPVTLDEYKAMIRSGKIQYAIVSSNGGSPMPSSNDDFSIWIARNSEKMNFPIAGFTLYKLKA